MAFGDPSNQFFAFHTPHGERLVCLLDEGMDGCIRGFTVLSRDIDDPSRGSWDPHAGMLLVEDMSIAMASIPIETDQAVHVDPLTRKLDLVGDGMTCPEGCTILYPAYFDTIPAGRRIESILEMDAMPDPPEWDEDEIDWADHHVAENRALARAESLI